MFSYWRGDLVLQVQLWFQYLIKTTQASPWRMLISDKMVIEINTFKGIPQDFLKDEMKWDSVCSFRTCYFTIFYSQKNQRLLIPGHGYSERWPGVWSLQWGEHRHGLRPRFFAVLWVNVRGIFCGSFCSSEAIERWTVYYVILWYWF